MAKRITHGEASFKVRRNALMMSKFTIAKLVEVTGLNPESVRTEVQRLRQKEWVVSEAVPGQHEAVYRLSDDPEKRLAFSRSIEAFYPESSKPVVPHPTSRMYQAAVQSIAQAEKEEGKKREELLKQAEHQLEGAWEAEGASRAPQLIQAYIQRARGRVAYLKGEPESAQKDFATAREVFAAVGLEGESHLIDEYLFCIKAKRRIDACRAPNDPVTQVNCILETLAEAEFSSIGSIAHLFADLTHFLAQIAEDHKAQLAAIKKTDQDVEKLLEEYRRGGRKEMPWPTFSPERPSEKDRQRALLLGQSGETFLRYAEKQWGKLDV